MKEFWESQAEKFKDDVHAVNFDPLEDELEGFFLEKIVENGEIVCDVGCGNGRATIALAQKKREGIFYGFDFAPKMIEVANDTKNKLKVENVHFYQWDATAGDLPAVIDFKFDKIISKRLLVNLKGENKFRAIENIYRMLKNNGTYIMIECFTEPLAAINNIRKNLGLDEIQEKHFNEYLTFDIFNDIKNKFRIERKIDFESLYYFISRVFNAYLSEGEPSYFAPINKCAIQLIKMGVNPIKGYSPEIIFLLRKV